MPTEREQALKRQETEWKSQAQQEDTARLFQVFTDIQSLLTGKGAVGINLLIDQLIELRKLKDYPRGQFLLGKDVYTLIWTLKDKLIVSGEPHTSEWTVKLS